MLKGRANLWNSWKSADESYYVHPSGETSCWRNDVMQAIWACLLPSLNVNYSTPGGTPPQNIRGAGAGPIVWCLRSGLTQDNQELLRKIVD